MINSTSLNEVHYAIEKTWTQFKLHFAAAHRQHKQMQGESLPQLVITLQMPPLATLKIKWLKPPLDH
jgi:hypothetical protein